MRRFCTLALALAIPSFASAGEWIQSYATAYDRAKEVGKPIFVYFTDSADNKDWKANFEGIQAADNFVLLVADKSDPEGAKLFETFEINKSTGTVVVEKTRQWQYFRTDRQLTKDQIQSVMTECTDASGKPTSSVLRAVSHSEPAQPTFEATTVRPAGYCPNCQRFR